MHHKLALLVTLFAFCVTLIFTTVAFAVERSLYTISFIDVGQGDSALIQSGDGFNVLIDGGRKSAGPTVAAYIRQQGINDIDVMMASHADVDHMGGLITVLEMTDVPVKQVLYNGYQGQSTAWYQFETAVAEEGLTPQPAQFPQTYQWGNADAFILNPAPDLSNPDQNDASVVILLDFGDVESLCF